MNTLIEILNAVPGQNPWWMVALGTLIKGGAIVGGLLSVTGYLVLLERRLLARLQHRRGPNRAGPFGLFQPLADVLKLLTKEDSNPPFVNKFLFTLAPMLIMITTLMSFAIIPFGPTPGHIVVDLNVAVLLFLGLSSLGVYSIVLAGWASNNKYAALGGLRATAQMISYELSMGAALLGVVLMAGSLSLQDIGKSQSFLPFAVLQPIGFVIFCIAAIAESRRTPFDLPEAENELVAGFHTEYSSMKFALFFLGEYVGMTLLSAVIVTCYLGAWHGPTFGLPFWLMAPLWMLVKMFILICIFIWIRGTMPRLRYDHLMELGWKYLLPLAVLNVLITAVICLAFPNLVPRAGL